MLSIFSLPPELLKLTFTYCLPENAEDVHSLTQSPTNVSQVCTLWRDVALSTPFLWSHLSFFDREKSRDWVTFPRQDRVLGLWKLWLSRSKNASLQYTVQSTRKVKGKTSYVNVLYRVLQIVASSVHRWRVIEISTYASFALFVHTLPLSLERLHIEGIPIHYQPCLDLEQINKALINTSGLITEPRVGQSYSTVTQNLRLFGETYFCLPSLQRRPVTLPALVDVTVGLMSQINTKELFDSITLPALLRLEVRKAGSDDIEVTGEVVGEWGISALIRRSSISLVELDICDINIPATEMTDILLQSPKLEILSYRHKAGETEDRCARAIVELLVQHSSASPSLICPSLRKIGILDDHFVWDAPEALWNMIISRWQFAKSQNADLTVETVRVPYFSPRNAEDTARYIELKRCVSEGLAIYHEVGYWNNEFLTCMFKTYFLLSCLLTYLSSHK